MANNNDSLILEGMFARLSRSMAHERLQMGETYLRNYRMLLIQEITCLLSHGARVL